MSINHADTFIRSIKVKYRLHRLIIIRFFFRNGHYFCISVYNNIDQRWANIGPTLVNTLGQLANDVGPRLAQPGSGMWNKTNRHIHQPQHHQPTLHVYVWQCTCRQCTHVRERARDRERGVASSNRTELNCRIASRIASRSAACRV